MANESDIPEDRRWLLEPAGPGEVRLNLEFGPDTPISPEVREAAERLVEALHVEDVSGYLMNGPAALNEPPICFIYAPPSCGTNSCTTRSALIGRMA